MPYSIVSDHPDCDGFAVIKDDNQEVLGCHKTEAQAAEQLTAINIAEFGTRELPENYRPASGQDVPEGRNCANCYFYQDGYCTLWDANVQANYYCNRWALANTENKLANGEINGRASRAESFTPTQAMREEAQRGLDWRSEFGRGGTEIGIARGRDIAGGKDLPLGTVNRMVSFFARHEIDKQAEGFNPGETGYPSNGRIAWALWGGDPGKTWAENIADQNREYDEDENDDTPRYNKALELLKTLSIGI
jgi:hypothetical protein